MPSCDQLAIASALCEVAGHYHQVGRLLLDVSHQCVDELLLGGSKVEIRNVSDAAHGFGFASPVPNEKRVAHALLRLVNQTGRKTELGSEIDFPISRQDIAEMTGTTLHTVSRLLSAWEDKGIIVSGRQKVTVSDSHRLMLLAENRDRK